MDQGAAALFGALIGGGLTALTTFGVEYAKIRMTRRNLSVAIAGEAAAVAEVVRRRDWQAQIAEYSRDAGIDGAVYQFAVHLPPDIVPTSRAAMTNAGLLEGDLPSLLSRFVMYADGIASDIRRLADYPPGHEKSLLRYDEPDAAARVYGELFAMLEEGLRVADRIVGEVKKQYPDVTMMTTVSSDEITDAMALAVAARKAQRDSD
ncbi:hypothetical protein [Lysobacter sp. HA35]